MNKSKNESGGHSNGPFLPSLPPVHRDPNIELSQRRICFSPFLVSAWRFKKKKLKNMKAEGHPEIGHRGRKIKFSQGTTEKKGKKEKATQKQKQSTKRKNKKQEKKKKGKTKMERLRNITEEKKKSEERKKGRTKRTHEKR